MMLPVIGFVAVGLLVAGIKLFFLSGPKPRAYEAVAVAEQKNSIALAPTKTLQNEKTEKEMPVSLPNSLISATPSEKKSLILAVPATGTIKRENESVVKGGGGKSGLVSRKTDTKNSMKKRHAPTKVSPEVKKKTDELKAIKNTALDTMGKQRSSSRWGIQVGSFTEKNVADSVVTKLKKKGYNVTIVSR